MKKIFISLMALCLFHSVQAQHLNDSVVESQQINRPTDSWFKGHFVNDELKIYLIIDLYDKGIIVPGQEVFGELDGYMGSDNTPHVWSITSSSTNHREAEIEMINNYGSEDLQATLTADTDSTFIYRHRGGSTLKFPNGNKWKKIPSKVVFKKKL